MSENAPVDQEASNARRGRAASGGAAARRAARSGGGPGTQLTYIKRKINVYEVLDEEGLALIEKNADTVLEEIGIDLPRRRRGAGIVERGRRRRQGRARAFPQGPAALAAEDRAVRSTPSMPAIPARSVADRRQRHGLRAGLRPAFRARPRWQPPLCDDRGFPQFREARLYGAVDPPFGRHGVRAGRRAGQQAPSRHGLQPHQIFGQAVHGLGDRAGACRRHRRHGQDRVRR